MPSTSYANTGASLSLGGFNFSFQGRINYDTPTRHNNTVTFNDVSVTIRYTGNGSSFTYGTGWDARARIPAGTVRASGFWSGTRSVGDTNTSGESGSFTVSVSSSTTSVSADVEGRFRPDAYTNSSNFSIPVPALPSPSLTSHSATNIKQKTADITYSANSGSGTNVTTTMSQVQLQYGLTTSYGTNVNKTTSSGTFNLTGLKPGATYHYRFVITNGGGKSTTTSDFTFKTKPVAGMLPVLMGLLR